MPTVIDHILKEIAGLKPLQVAASSLFDKIVNDSSTPGEIMSQQNVQNPGTINPADQSYAPNLQPSRPQGPASSSTVNSSGDVQLPAQQASLAACGGPQGLATEVNAGHSSQVKSQPPSIATTYPPARNVQAGTDRPGGLPVNVMVK
jgi:hypothetical protein